MTVTELAAPPSRCPAGLTAAIRRAVSRHGDWGQTAQRVAAALGAELPGPGILSAAERRGDPDSYQTHLLHTEPDGTFSIVAVVWRPGQVTLVHDHVTWCVAGVLQGAEDEELFTLADGGTAVRPAGRNLTGTGSVTGFAPPGDIHRVRAPGPGVTVSLHVYGADISRLGSSVRRVYQLPVLRAKRARRRLDSAAGTGRRAGRERGTSDRATREARRSEGGWGGGWGAGGAKQAEPITRRSRTSDGPAAGSRGR